MSIARVGQDCILASIILGYISITIITLIVLFAQLLYAGIYWQYMRYLLTIYAEYIPLAVDTCNYRNNRIQYMTSTAVLISLLNISWYNADNEANEQRVSRIMAIFNEDSDFNSSFDGFVPSDEELTVKK